MLVVLDMVFQYLHAIKLCCIRTANGSPMLVLFLLNHLGGSCGIFCLHILQLWMLSQELTALHESHWMGMNLGNGVPVIVRQTADTVGDMQFMLSNDGGPRLSQQFVVMQQGACYRVFDGCHTNHGGVFFKVVEHLFECSTAHQLYLFSFEIQMCCDVVKRPYQSLYCYSLHNPNKNPAFTFSVKRDCISFFIFQFFISYIRPSAPQVSAK